jgi:putative chitinase
MARRKTKGHTMADLLTLAVLQRMWPHGDQHVAGLLEGIVAAAPETFEKHGVTTLLEVAHMMGQFSEECGAGLEMVENLNYSAEGLLRTFPTHFTASMAERCAHNQRMIGDIAYGGRMGNAPPPSDDGFNFRGRGLSQTTGKGAHEPPKPLEGYAALAAATGLPLLDNPDLVNDPAHAFECGVCDFVKLCGCLPFAQRDDVVEVTKHLNGGLNGLPARRDWVARWKTALGI